MEKKRSPWRLGHSCENNIEIYLQEIGCEVERTGLGLDLVALKHCVP